jgi:hypothetical protein
VGVISQQDAKPNLWKVKNGVGSGWVGDPIVDERISTSHWVDSSLRTQDCWMTGDGLPYELENKGGPDVSGPYKKPGAATW